MPRKLKPKMQVHAPFYLDDKELAALQSWYEKTFPKYQIEKIVRGHSGATVIFAEPMPTDSRTTLQPQPTQFLEVAHV